MADTFFFDDFFADPDASIEIRPQLWQNGELVEVPIQIRRRLSLAQREGIKQSSVAFEVNTQTGELTPKSVDQERMTVLALVAIIVDWPFTYKNGSKVPVTEKTVGALGAQNADAIMAEFAKLDQIKAEAREPFAAPSEAA